MIGENMQVSVIVLTYNPDYIKLKKTLNSIIMQKDISIEIIVSDDGSAEDFEEKITSYFHEAKFDNYYFNMLENNEGTVKNYAKGLKCARGEYVYGISPGDILFDQYTLSGLYEFAKQGNKDIVFGNLIGYSFNKIIDMTQYMRYAKIFSDDYSDTYKKMAYFFENRIYGPCFFRKVEVALKDFAYIEGVSKYVEDNTTTAYSLIRGSSLYYYDKYVVWYECGSGISTNGNSVWKKKIEEDFLKVYQKIEAEFDDNVFNLFFKVRYIATSKLKKLLCMIKQFKLFFIRCKLKLLKKRYASNLTISNYDENRFYSEVID